MLRLPWLIPGAADDDVNDDADADVCAGFGTRLRMRRLKMDV